LRAISYAKRCQVLKKSLSTEIVGVGGMASLIGHFDKITQVEFIVHEKNVFRESKLSEKLK